MTREDRILEPRVGTSEPARQPGAVLHDRPSQRLARGVIRASLAVWLLLAVGQGVPIARAEESPRAVAEAGPSAATGEWPSRRPLEALGVTIASLSSEDLAIRRILVEGDRMTIEGRATSREGGVRVLRALAAGSELVADKIDVSPGEDGRDVYLIEAYVAHLAAKPDGPSDRFALRLDHHVAGDIVAILTSICGVRLEQLQGAWRYVPTTVVAQDVACEDLAAAILPALGLATKRDGDRVLVGPAALIAGSASTEVPPPLDAEHPR